MIADCETCERKQVPCKSCQESQRAICFLCQGDVADPYCELEGKREYEDAMLRPIVEARDDARANFANFSGTEMRKEPEYPTKYTARLRTHVEEDGQLSHQNGLALLEEVERLQGLVPVYLGGTRGK